MDDVTFYLYLSCNSDTTEMKVEYRDWDGSVMVPISVTACTQHPLPNYILPHTASAEITSLELT